jgi:glycosyltransferase involved in cell wall biosynthesis
MIKKRIAIDISSIESDHRFRGIGTYTKQLLENVEKIAENDSEVELVPFSGTIPEADLYHFPAFNPFFFSFPLGIVKKSIFTIHDLIPIEYPEQYPAGVKGNLRWVVQKLFLKQSRAIITDSTYSADSIQRLMNYPDDRIHVIYLAADSAFKEIQEMDETEDTLVRLAPPTRFVLYVGDVNWNKNLMMVSKVCVELKIPLVVVGKQATNSTIDRHHPWNKDLVAFQDFAKLHSDVITCYGYVNTQDLVSLYNWAWCYVQPSVAEGFGLPVLEAMSCGCLVLCANSSSLPEVAGDAALYFDPLVKTSLKEKLRYIWDTRNGKALEKYQKKAVERAKNFSWEKTATKTWETYKVYL